MRFVLKYTTYQYSRDPFILGARSNDRAIFQRKEQSTMTSQGFRFLHASDFRLELPVDGLLELPDRCGSAVLDAPRAAVERLFDAAIKEKVDFVVLSGDLLSPRDAGPWGVLFLIEQFERLRAERIPVYWAAGKSDASEAIPAAFRFPDNVRVFSTDHIEETFFEREGVPVARLLGASRGSAALSPRSVEPIEDVDDLYTIGVFNGRLPSEAVKSDSVRYWAMGGTKTREVVSRSPSLAVYAGSTLARNFSETGDYGATLVEVGESGRTTTSLIRTSPLRWSVETLVVREDETEDEILNEARARLKAIRERALESAAYLGRTFDDDVWFVKWRVEADPSVLPALRYGTAAQTILRDLRADFATSAPIIYAVDIEPVLPEKMPEEMYERQTILGDYLRMIRYYWENPSEEIDLESFMPNEVRDWAALARVKREIANRRRLDGETADLGDLPARLAALEAKEFRPEVAELFDLTSFDPDLDDAGVDEAARAAAIAERRRAALLEAAALGVDLLSETDSPVALLNSGATTKALPKKNRAVAAELRELSRNLDGKELDS